VEDLHLKPHKPKASGFQLFQSTAEINHSATGNVSKHAATFITLDDPSLLEDQPLSSIASGGG